VFPIKQLLLYFRAKELDVGVNILFVGVVAAFVDLLH
jgi:hypothetical protein